MDILDRLDKALNIDLNKATDEQWTEIAAQAYNVLKLAKDQQKDLERLSTDLIDALEQSEERRLELIHLMEKIND